MSSPQSQNDTNLGISFNPGETSAVTAEAREASVRETSASHLSNQGDVFDVGKAFTSTHGEVGTIVSDRKHLRPSIGESLKDAFSEWWGKTERKVARTAEALKKYDEKEPEVAKAETRVETIKEAVKDSPLAPKDDHRVVIEKIRTLQSDTVRATGAPVVIKVPVKTAAKGSWTYTTEEQAQTKITKLQPPRPAGGTPDLRQTAIAPHVDRKIKKSVAEYVPQKHASLSTEPKTKTVGKSSVQVGYMSVPDTVPQRMESQSTSIIGVREPVVEGKAIVSETQTAFTTTREALPPLSQPERGYRPPIVPSPEPVKPRQEQVVPEVSTRAHVPQVTKDTVASPVFHGVSALPHVAELSEPHAPEIPTSDTSRQRFTFTPTTWAMLGGAVVVGIILAIGASVSVMLFRDENNEVAQETLTVPAFFKTEEQLSIALESNPVSFLTALKNEVVNSPHASVQLYPVTMRDSVSHVATAEEFFTFLRVRLGREAVRALEPALMVGGISAHDKVPFVIIRSYNFDVLFAELLAWEKYMFVDLSPLFTSPSPVTNSLFRDTIVNNRPARVLYNDVGGAVLIYSFINQDTVVITTDGAALAKVTEQF